MIDKDSEFTEIIQFILQPISCQAKISTLFNHSSLSRENQTQNIGMVIAKHLSEKREMWSL